MQTLIIVVHVIAALAIVGLASALAIKKIDKNSEYLIVNLIPSHTDCHKFAPY